MRYIILALILFAVALILLQPQQKPFEISEDLAVTKDFIKKPHVDQTISLHKFTRYTEETKKVFSDKNENDLLGIRCSDTFIRTPEGMYLLENTKTSKRMLKRVKNGEFLGYMRRHETNLPKGTKPLTARVCEDENQTLFVFYSAGKYDFAAADRKMLSRLIIESTENYAYVHIIPSGLFAKDRIVEIARSKNYLHCDEPFMLTKKSELFVLCSEGAPWKAAYFVYQTAVDNGKVTLLKTCTNLFKDKLTVSCD